MERCVPSTPHAHRSARPAVFDLGKGTGAKRSSCVARQCPSVPGIEWIRTQGRFELYLVPAPGRTQALGRGARDFASGRQAALRVE